MTNKYVLFDLDNCLSDDTNRLKLIDKSKTGNARYEAYHAAFAEDKPNLEAVNVLLAEVLNGRTPIFITGRPECHRDGTIGWLHRNVFGPAELPPSFLLWMRPNNNNMPSNILKPWLIETFAFHTHQFAAAYDDFESVLSAYRDMGIPCRKLAVHRDRFNERGDSGAAPSEEALAAFDEQFPSVPPDLTGQMFPAQPEVDGAIRVISALKPRTQSAADILQEMSDTFRARNKVYGSNFRMVAKLMAVLFPNGVPPDLVVKDQFHLFELILVKLSRYAISNLSHQDSIHDAGVYAAMCESINKEQAA